MGDVAEIVTAPRLNALCPKIRGDILEAILTEAPTAFPKAGLDDPVRIAHFFAQIMTETGGLARLDENLNYTTAARLMKVFGKKAFPSAASAGPFVRNPEALANHVYANKIGNGNEASGDGWLYRGSGLIQLTGRGNFRAVDKSLGTNLEAEPEQARHGDSALAIALAYWTKHKINGVAKGTTDADVKAVTKLINPAFVGLKDRQANFKKALRVFMPPAAAVRAMAVAASAPAAAPTDADELSGPAWVARFPTSQKIEDLVEPFREEAEAFVAALEAAGARVAISATYRPKERAYLMHWAWEVSKGFDPAQVPSMPGVAIIWAHPTSTKSRAAAKAMVAGYGMVHVAALNSRHTERRAIDMTLAWSGTLKITEKAGGTRTISTQPRNGSNRELIEVGAGYGCIKLPSDPPHWSDDGR